MMSFEDFRNSFKLDYQLIIDLHIYSESTLDFRALIVEIKPMLDLDFISAQFEFAAECLFINNLIYKSAECLIDLID